VWSINEAISVIDRLTKNINKKPKDVILDIPTVQLIISTFVERIRATTENSFFRFVYLDHPIITDSRILIKDYHLSPNDAVHIFTAHVYDCNYFLVQDKKLIKEVPTKK
jgi:predicted nucleic acid-binding protein